MATDQMFVFPKSRMNAYEYVCLAKHAMNVAMTVYPADWNRKIIKFKTGIIRDGVDASFTQFHRDVQIGDKILYIQRENLGTKKFPDIVKNYQVGTVKKVTEKCVNSHLGNSGRILKSDIVCILKRDEE